MNRLLIDTHVLVWIVFAEPHIKSSTLEAIEEASMDHSLFLSPISLWEIALKHSRGKLNLDRPIRDWLHHALSIANLNLVPITPSIAAECAELPSTFHGDPADRIIAATARAEGFTLVTHDKILLQLSRQGYFKTLAT